MTEQELAFINGELGVCGSRLVVLDRMIVAGGYASRTYLTDRHAEWLRYKTALEFVRDQRPDPAHIGTVEI